MCGAGRLATLRSSLPVNSLDYRRRPICFDRRETHAAYLPRSRELNNTNGDSGGIDRGSLINRWLTRLSSAVGFFSGPVGARPLRFDHPT